MPDYSLTADVPLGPFEGTQVTLHSAKSKNAKLHATTSCTQLRTSDVTTVRVPLDAATIGRLCARCTHWGSWVRPETGLGIFLTTLGGFGLLYELHAYTTADDDEDWDQDELWAAATLLHTEPGEPEQNDVDEDLETGEARDDAERLRDRVFVAWRGAAKSLHRARSAAEMFPWLEDWAKPKLTLKEQYLETLRTQAASFVDPDGLLAAAVAAGLDEPEPSFDSDEFKALGTPKDISNSLKALWRNWQHKASKGWGRPGERAHVADSLVHGIRTTRKGYDKARSGARRLVAEWESQARTATASAAAEPRRLMTVRLPKIAEDRPHQGERGFLARLDQWTLGVLLTCLTDADWAHRTLTLHVPDAVADRLLADSFWLDCEPHTTNAGAQTATRADSAADPIQPGIFDDTPVLDRRPVTAHHLRALRTASPDADQLYIVFSTSTGVEVLPLAAIEKRLAHGWQGVIVAGASDLPTSVIEPWTRQVGSRPEPPERIWPERVRDADDPRFGDELGLEAGARAAAWLAYRDQDRERNLRRLALARAVNDLRTLDDDYYDDGHRRTVPRAVWHGLLAEDTLDLEPFEPATTDRWRSGSNIPLGVLAGVQIYTTNANPRLQGKGHSPLCKHSRERGVIDEDDLLTVADLLTRDDFDWCSKCGGYAVRRLTDTQLSYYRAAHRLHDIAQQLDPERAGYVRGDAQTISSQLSELAGCHPIGQEHWYTSGSRRWQKTVSDLQHKAEAARRRDIP